MILPEFRALSDKLKEKARKLGSNHTSQHIASTNYTRLKMPYGFIWVISTSFSLV